MMAPLQAALLKLLLSPMAAAQSTLELQSVVLLSRHGIRTPCESTTAALTLLPPTQKHTHTQTHTINSTVHT